MSKPDQDPEQDKLLDDGNEEVKKNFFFMKRAWDGGDQKEGLRYLSLMIGELRTSRLSPRPYYDLFMNVTDKLRDVETDFDVLDTKDTSGNFIVELYERVQHAGSIIPRLYLLITVASSYIKSCKAPAKDVLFDLVELCRGVQHPTRGLFLRHYLSQVAKDKTPDVDSKYGTDVKAGIEFVLQNFAEMNKLWVRMQHQGAFRDRARRERERRNLRMLVGNNLVRLSELKGVDLERYQTVLPRILEQVVNCKDVIAQEYLMDVIIQVFPDKFHLATLDAYLATLAQLQPKVNRKHIIITLMNRLSTFALEYPEGVPSDLEMFPLFHKYSTAAQETLELCDVLDLQVALVNFATKVYPTRREYIDLVLGEATRSLAKNEQQPIETRREEDSVKKLLSLPLQTISLGILGLKNYAPLLEFLGDAPRKDVAKNITEAVVEAESPLSSAEETDALFKYLGPLVQDTGDIPEDELFEFDQEQSLVARLVHLIQNEDTKLHFQLYALARNQYFGKGGTRRIAYTLPPLLFGCHQLLRRIHEEGEAKQVRHVFGFVHETTGGLRSHYPGLAFRLFIDGSKVAGDLGYEAIAYEFIVQAFTTYEEEITDSREQFAAITYMCAALGQIQGFGQENYDTLISKATQHSAKLLKKPDQCRAVYQCAHLFWDTQNTEHQDEKRVLACLQRSLKIANACMGSQIHLFVEILNKYLYFFEHKCPSITTKYLKGLIALIDEHLPNLDQSETSQLAKSHYENTKAHIQSKCAEDPERYGDIL